MSTTLKNSIPGLACSIIVIVLTLAPGSYFQHIKITFWDWLSPDKVAHLMMYAGLSFSSLWGFRKTYKDGDKNKRRKLVIVIFLASLVLAAATELLQSIPPLHRHSCIYDFAANTIGCVLGTYIFVATHRTGDKKNSPALDSHK